MTEAEAATGFAAFGMEALSLPLLLSVPHAGRDYPDDIFANLRVPQAALVRLEDRYADLSGARSDCGWLSGYHRASCAGVDRPQSRRE